VQKLISAQHEVAILDRVRCRKFPHLWIAGDVRQRDTLEHAFAGADVIFNLAAEHHDDVRPVDRYREVNVGGAENICHAALRQAVSTIIFTSTVAVYGLPRQEADEQTAPAPFNEYGRTKLAAEAVHRRWLARSPEHSLTIIRPSVVFGEGNRGNVYNLVRQIAGRRFAMIGNGRNRKSMAYVENVAGFLEFALRFGPGEQLFNYADKPDMDMTTLFGIVLEELGRGGTAVRRIPYGIGLAAGTLCDGLARLTGRKLPISAVRVRKFCANTRFSAERAAQTGFVPEYSLEQALRRTVAHEFGTPQKQSRAAA
jgi:GlcNAc-P-P-Und epimerase